jgi:hypothetical protein
MRTPTTRTLTLPNGDWLLVKEHLTAGDQRRVLRGSMKRIRNLDGHEVDVVDGLQAPLAQAAAYLLDWSLRDPQGAPIPIRGLDDAALVGVLDMLPPEDCEEIAFVIDVHDTEMRALRAAEKKASDGGRKSPATWPSPDSSAGATNGSPSSTPTSMDS